MQVYKANTPDESDSYQHAIPSKLFLFLVGPMNNFQDDQDEQDAVPEPEQNLFELKYDGAEALDRLKPHDNNADKSCC